MSPPALQSHPWWEPVSGSLRSRVPESLLCAPPGWCSPASLPRRTCSTGGGASGEKAEGSRAESPAWENGKARGTGSENGNERWSSSSQSAPLWAPGAGWGWRISGWSAGVWSVRSAGRSLWSVREGHPCRETLNPGSGCVGWQGNGCQGGWWKWCRSFSEKWCEALLGCWKVWWRERRGEKTKVKRFSSSRRNRSESAANVEVSKG